MARLRNLRIAIGLALVGAVGLSTALATFSGNPPTETFDGNPASPQAFSSAEFDVQVHSRDSDTWFDLEPIDAQHGADCSGPPNSHVNTSYEGSVFICRDHMMTALNASGYGAIYLTPNQMLDWSSGEAVLSFDMSTLRMSRRDWVDIWLTPYASNLALPLDNWLPDLQGTPAPNYIHIRMDDLNGGGTGFKIFVNGVNVGTDHFTGYEQRLTPDAARRDRFELRIGNGRLSFGMPAYNIWWADNVAVDPGFTRSIVQFGHHSYTPTKDNSGVPGTWHWDNVSLSPSVPFSIQRANERYIAAMDGQPHTGTVTFPPAPANAYLRFSAVGSVTVNGQPVEPQPSSGPIHFEHFASYFVPIPQGSTSATIGLGPRGWYDHWAFFAKDFHVWSLSQSAPTSPTASSTGTPTATSTTPIPTATDTPPATATPTNTSVPTATATATSTPVPPTPTPTPTPVNARCTVRDRNDANTGWLEREGVWVEIAPNAWTCAVTSVGRVP